MSSNFFGHFLRKNHCIFFNANWIDMLASTLAFIISKQIVRRWSIGVGRSRCVCQHSLCVNEFLPHTGVGLTPDRSPPCDHYLYGKKSMKRFCNERALWLRIGMVSLSVWTVCWAGGVDCMVDAVRVQIGLHTFLRTSILFVFQPLKLCHIVCCVR